jgi:hypothetical protein
VSSTASEDITPPSSLLRTHAPDQIPPTDLGRPIIRWVFAGCRPSLLGDGPSRRYLYNPCVGAWTLTPPCSSGALARFFPEDAGFTSPIHVSHTNLSLQCNFSRGYLSRLQSFDYLQAPTLARFSSCTHLNISGGRTVYTTQNLVGCLPQAVASLRM